MTTHDALTALTTLPARRSPQELHATLAGIAPGHPVRAVFKSDRHGVFAVDGALRTGIGGDLGVGAYTLGNSRRVEGDLVRIVALDAAPEAPADTPVASLEHGDLVRAHLHHDVLGPLALTGVVTESDHDRFALVGGWVITDAGRHAPRVVAVERLFAAADHDLAVPRRRPRRDDAG